MEKKVVTRESSCIRVILTGPESTGKTELASSLAESYGSLYIPEYARNYITKLNRRYNYSDIKKIARHQVQQMEEFSAKNYKVIFVDTYLLITRVWFDWLYKKHPAWLDKEILKTKRDLYLLCKPDIPWYPDEVRENGGETRNQLFVAYETELKKFGLHYKYVSGSGPERISNACNMLDLFLAEQGLTL